MPWAGGKFTRSNGEFGGSTVWQTDRDAAHNIEADRHDAHDQDLANGINACLPRDGSAAMVASLDMGNQTITNLAPGQLGTDLPQMGQTIQTVTYDNNVLTLGRSTSADFVIDFTSLDGLPGGSRWIGIPDVATMKAASYLQEGHRVRTGGHSAALFGVADYEVVAPSTGTDDNGSFITLNSGRQAKAIFGEKVVTMGQFGAKGDGTTDDTTAVQACFDYAAANGATVVGWAGRYLCSDSIIVKSNFRYFGRGAVFVKGFLSTDKRGDALFKNENYADDPNKDSNIRLVGIEIEHGDTTYDGSFISFNWIDGLTIADFRMINTAGSWTMHLCGKNIEVSNGYLNSVNIPGGASNGDGIHFEYAENVRVNNVTVESNDDSLAFQYQQSTNSSAGPNIASKNIVVSNCVLRSDKANGVRVGAGNTSSPAGTIVANGYFTNVLVSNCVIEKIGTSGSAVAMQDLRSSYANKHDRIVFDGCTIIDDTSTAQMVTIYGNDDVTNASNIADRNYGSVRFNDCSFYSGSAGAFFQGGAVEDLKISGGRMIRTTQGGNEIDLRMVDNLEIVDMFIDGNASSNGLIVRDYGRISLRNSRLIGGGSEFAALRIDQPTATNGTIELDGLTFENHAKGIDSITAITLDKFWFMNSDTVGVSGTLVSANISYTNGQVKNRGGYA